MAVQSFRGLGWFVAAVVVVPACYLVTSQGAAERARLNAVEAKIAATAKEIRTLETEYGTRANLAQLQQWNGEAEGLKLAAPAPQQFLASETQLASLDAAEAQPGDKKMLAVVPAGAPVALAQAAPVPAHAQPAVLTRDPAQPKPGPAVVASRTLDAGIKAKLVKVAMADSNRLLSASTMDDLTRGAAREQLNERLALR